MKIILYEGKDDKKYIKRIRKKLDIFDISDHCITCNPSSKDGYFETLFLSCVPDNLKKCYDEFIECSGFKEKENYKTIITKLHELASPNKPYAYEHENFSDIKTKLKNLFKEQK